MQRIHAVKETVNKIYETLGIARSNSRKRINVQARAAISVALKPYCNTYEIGEAVERDRSTCSFYTSKHFTNMDYWPGYSDIYNTAKEVVDNVLEDYMLASHLDYINDRMDTLEKTRKSLLKRLKKEEVNETA
jgi:hypothetical protein|tara:strand:+ start:388 stop:786 length:399 start_codon:yes stop_codon:yes gene_type:complete